MLFFDEKFISELFFVIPLGIKIMCYDKSATKQKIQAQCLPNISRGKAMKEENTDS